MELQIVTFFNHFGHGTFLDKFTYATSDLLFVVGVWVLVAILVLIFNPENSKWLLLGLLIAALCYFVINDFIVKPTIANFYFRERPYLAYPNLIYSLKEPWTDSSFYSGHMASSAALVAIVCYFYRLRWVWIASIAFLILMAFDRLHNGMHYPSDIFVGTLVGFLYGLLTIWIINQIRRPKKA